jgi:hypothetical protein
MLRKPNDGPSDDTMNRAIKAHRVIRTGYGRFVVRRVEWNKTHIAITAPAREVLSILGDKRKILAAELMDLDGRISKSKAQVESNGTTKASKHARKKGWNAKAIIDYLKIYPEGRTHKEIASEIEKGLSAVYLTTKDESRFLINHGKVFLK